MKFKEITIDSIKELQPYFDLVDYEACEYCFTTLYMWQHVYKTGYVICDDFAVIMAEYEGNSFSILPLAKKEKLPHDIGPADRDYITRNKQKRQNKFGERRSKKQ